MRVARHFSAWIVEKLESKSREGRLTEIYGLSRPLRDSRRYCRQIPGTEVPGYFHSVPPGRAEFQRPHFAGFLIPPALRVECSFDVQAKNAGSNSLKAGS